MAIKQLSFMVSLSNIDNNIGVVAPVGELTTSSRTFSTSIQEIVSPTSSNLLLTVLKNSNAGTETSVTTEVSNKIFEVHNKLMLFFTDNPSETNVITIATAVELGTNANNLVLGPLILTANNTIIGYQSISFNYHANDGSDNEITLWFADSAISTQYPGTTYIVIPPVADITTLKVDKASLTAISNNLDTNTILTNTSTAVSNKPATSITPVTITHYGSDDAVNGVSLPWTVIAYGPGGSDVTNLRGAIREKINELDGNDLTVWSNTYVKDLFTVIEMMVIPNWREALPAVGAGGNVYSPIEPVENTIQDVLSKDLGYSESYIRQHIDITTFQYKNLGIALVAGISNASNKKHLATIYPDYTSLPTTNANYSKMSVNTRAFVTFLTDLITVAEDSSILNSGTINTVTTAKSKGTTNYITAEFGGVEYWVYRKNNSV